jgi:hypothetical protein
MGLGTHQLARDASGHMGCISRGRTLRFHFLVPTSRRVRCHGHSSRLKLRVRAPHAHLYRRHKKLRKAVGECEEGTTHLSCIVTNHSLATLDVPVIPLTEDRTFAWMIRFRNSDIAAWLEGGGAH